MPETVKVRGASDSLFEGMTKEQTYSAIESATGGTVGDIGAFITSIKEQNNDAALTFWVGTTAQYNALETKPANCLFILTDDTSAADIATAITALQTASTTAANNISTMQTSLSTIGQKLSKFEIVDEAEDATLTLAQIFAKYSANYVLYYLNSISDTSIYPVTVSATPGSTSAAVVTLEKVGNVGRFVFDYRGDCYYNSIYASSAQGGYSTTGWVKMTNEAV